MGTPLPSKAEIICCWVAAMPAFSPGSFGSVGQTLLSSWSAPSFQIARAAAAAYLPLHPGPLTPS